MTSFSEGFPTILIEAGIANNLIISSKFEGYDLILNEDNSLLFENMDELETKLKKSIENLSDLSRFQKNFIIKFVKFFI